MLCFYEYEKEKNEKGKGERKRKTRAQSKGCDKRCMVMEDEVVVVKPS